MLAELVQSLVIVLMLTCQSRSSDPLDIILFSGTPLVYNDSNSWFRGYTLQDDKDIRDLSVGVLYKYIDGKENVTWDDITGEVRNQDKYMDMPDDKIFHKSSRIGYRVHGDFTYLGVLSLPTQTERVGVYSFEANKGGIVTNSAIVLKSASAIIEFEYRTITVSIGESVSINIRNGSFIDNIRWRHNYEELYYLRNASSIVIENVQTKDDGVYECYIGDNPDGNHGIMRLIVRACPSPKWSLPDCEMDCPVCYNNGVCDDKTGVCICPAGFDGDACKNDCGNNNWGRDCLNVCSSQPGSTCRGALVCPPDPAGCTCVNGFEGNDCDTECTSGYFGADCGQKCHCNDSYCDIHTGCNSYSDESMCSSGYTGDTCQVPMDCPFGLFGMLCNFPCHCKDSAGCNRDGSCPNGCQEAWSGSDCSIALPYRSEPPTVINQTATTITFDVTWIFGEDYGTGTITKRKLWYKSSQMDSFLSINEPDNGSSIVIDNLIPNEKVEFYCQFSRMVGGIEVDGPRSALGSTNTICTKPLDEPATELKTIEDNQIILSLKPVSRDYDRIQCNSILRYQVQYWNIYTNVKYVINYTTISSKLEVKLSKLSSCSAYIVNARVVNNMDIAGRWGQDTAVQTTPTEPTIQGNPFANGTLLLIKWNASTCDISNYHVIYHYELSGGIFLKGTTSETEVVLDVEIQFCKNYTFSVLASYVNVYGKSNTRTIISGTDCDPDPIRPMPVYGIVIGSILAAVFTVTVMLIIIKRFILRRSKKDVDKSLSRTTTQQNVCTIDTNYKGLRKKYEYESGRPKSDVVTSSAEPIHTNTEVPEHFSDFTNMKTRRENETSPSTVNDSDEPVYADPEQEREPEPVYDKSEYEKNNSAVATYSDEPVYTDPEQEREPEPVYDKSEYEKNNSTVATYSDEPVYTDPEQEREPEPQFVYNENEYNNIKSTRSVLSSVKHVHPDHEPLPERISGNTESESQEYKPIELSKLRDYVMKHLLKKEFEALNSLFPDYARRADFSFKKTFHGVLFLTKGCSQLNPDVDSGVDYVNDSFIERYRDRHTFIVARNPSLNTTIDFWRLVFDCKSDVIVQLNEVEDLNCAVYLPKKKNERLKCYEYTVTLESTVLNQFGTERRFILEKDNTVRQMIQYEVKQWPKNEPVPKVNAFVKFVMAIMEGCDTSSNNTPITVHCIDGVCRSGLFCLVYSMIEKMREEKIVDVFQTLKALRSASSNMVNSQIQYNFCYEAALCYLRWCEDNKVVVPNN